MTLNRLLMAASGFLLSVASLVYSESGVAAAAQESSDALSECVSEKRSLSALFLVDASLSLQSNDPEDERVEAVYSALSALGALHSSTDVDVNIEFLDFSDITRKSFSERTDWASVPVAAAAQLAIARQFTDRNEGGATDYVAALEPWFDTTDKPVDEIGALEMLERAPSGSCRLLVWFTDGQLDVGFYGTPRTVYWTETPTIINSNSLAATVETLAIERLCESGGLADRLRQGSDIASGTSAQVSIVALDKQGTLDFGLLRAFATGAGRDGGCGSETPRGTFGTAEDIGALAISLREAVLGEDHGPPGGTQSCLVSSGECFDVTGDPREYDYTFYMSSGFQQFNLLTLSSHPSVTTTLISPRGSTLVLQPGVTLMQADGVDLGVLALELQNGAFLVDGELSPDGEWVGHWRVRYSTSDPEIAAGLNRASIYVFGSLMLTLDEDQPALQAGLEEDIAVRVVGRRNEPATETLLQPGTQMRLWVNDDATSTPILQPDGTYSVRFTVPTDFAGETVNITGLLEPIIRLAADAPLVPLTPWSGFLGGVAVIPIGDFPVVRPPDPFDQALEESVRSISTTMAVDASRPGTAGCVDFVDLVAPRIGANDLGLRVTVNQTRIATGERCSIDLAEGDTASVTVVVDASELASLDGEILSGNVTLRSSNPIDPTRYRDYTYDIEFSVQLPPPLPPPPTTTIPEPETTTIPEPETTIETDAAKAALLFVIAVLFLVVLLYISNFVASRLVVGRLTAFKLPVGIDGSVMYRLDDDGNRVRLVVEGPDINSHPLGRGEGRANAIEVNGVMINARTPLVPGSRSLAAVSYRGATLMVASRGTSKNGRVGRMSNVLSGEWVFYTEQLIPEVREGSIHDPIVGVFMMMIPYGSDSSFAQAQLDEQTEAIAERVLAAATEVSAAQLEERPADEDDDEAIAEDELNEEGSGRLAQELETDSTSHSEIGHDDDSLWDFEGEDDW